MKLSNLLLPYNFSSLVFAMAAIPAPTHIPYELECNTAYISYMAGCIDHYMGRSWSEDQIHRIVSRCMDKAEDYTKAINACSQAEFVK